MVNSQGPPPVENSALIAVVIVCGLVRVTGSSFWATWVRPTLRKRLEASPLIVWVIEFIGISIGQNLLNLDSANDLFPRPLTLGYPLVPRLIAGSFADCPTVPCMITTCPETPM